MLSGYFMSKKNRNAYINEIDRISLIRDGKNKINSYLVVDYLVTK